MMYLIQQPKRLESLAVVKLADWIALQAQVLWSLEINANKNEYLHGKKNNDPGKAADISSHRIQIIRNTLEYNMPKMLHDKLFEKLMQALEHISMKEWQSSKTVCIESYKKNSFFRISETLFTKNLTTMVIDYFNMARIRKTLFHKAHMLSGLMNLEIQFTNGYMGVAEESDIINLLNSLPNLRHLKIENVCTDNVLKCLAEHCKQIEKLNLIYSTHVNDMSIQILTQLLHLKHINVSSTSVTKIGIAHLLKSCGNIEVIEDIWSNTIAAAIQDVKSMEEYADTKFQLKFYSNYHDTTSEQLKSVIQMCPQLHKIELVKYEYMQGSLKILTNLQNLQELTLKLFDFCTDHVKEVLEAGGPKLVKLSLIAIKQLGLNSLLYISQMCPKLEILTIEYNYLPDLDESDQKPSLEILPFKHLNTLIIYVMGSLSKTIEAHLLFLLTNCPNVEYMKTSVGLTDDIMLKVLDKNPLKYLRKLKMLNGSLTPLVLDQIIQNCIVPPKLINYFEFIDDKYYEF